MNENGNEAGRDKLGIPRKRGSGHTTSVGGYVIKSHVPASDIKRLLKDKLKVIGLAVPSMSVGSPGMDGTVYDGPKDPTTFYWSYRMATRLRIRVIAEILGSTTQSL